MANRQNLRHFEQRSAVRRGRPSRARLLLALLVVGAGAALAVLLVGGASRPAVEHAPFVAAALGRPAPQRSAIRRPAAGIKVALAANGFSVSSRGHAVELRNARSTVPWNTFTHGVRRPTSFGHEAIVVDGSRAEQYLTVERHLGTTTWRWALKTLNLKPRLGDDGSVGFLIGGRTLSGTAIAPARIYDGAGHDLTPAGTRWALADGGTTLSLTVDDRELPVPYVVDPAVTYDAAGTVGSGATTNVALAVPAGVRVGDVLIAHFATRGVPTISTTPAGWAANPAATANTTVKNFVYWHKVAAGDPATFTWVLSAAQEWAGAIMGFSGLRGSGPTSVNGAAGTGANVNNVSAPAIAAGVVANSVEVATYALASGAAALNWNTPAGAPAMTQIFQAQSPNATAANRVSLASDYAIHGAGAATVARTGSCTNCSTANMIGIQSTWLLDTTAPTAVTLNAPAATLRSTVTLTGSATENDSSLDLVFQRSPAGAGTWTTIGTATTSPYQASFDTTGVADGFYDLRVVARNGAWSSAADDVASAVATVRVDNSSPDQNVLSITELTGGQFQYFDSAANTQYYNPLGGNGTFRLTAAPRDVQDSIQLRGSSSGGDGTGGPLTLAKPAGTTTGDVMILHISYETGTSATLVPPAGWTLLLRRDVGTFWGQVAYYKVATAGEPASYVFSLTAAGANISGGITAWTGVSTTNPVDVFAGGTATSLTITAPSVTTKAGCDRLLALNGIWTTTPSITPAATMTERYDAASAELQWDTGSEGADQILGAAGATGTRVATATSAAANSQGDLSNSGIAVALRPNVCVKSVVFPAPGQTGFAGGGNTATVVPYNGTTYSFNNTNTTEPGAKIVTTNDEAGNTPLQTTVTMTRDVTAPSFASAPTAGGFYNTLSVPVVTTTATDAAGGSGVDATTYTVQRDTGTATTGTCAWNNIWATVTLTAGNDNTVTGPRCYRYRMRVLDNVSNAGTSAASAAVIVDQTSPAAGAISIAESNASTHVSGATVFYRPGGGGGSFDVTDTGPTDAHSGVVNVRFPGLTGGLTPTANTDDSSAPYTQSYNWTTGATDSGSKTITVFDAAGNTVNTSFTLTSDSASPTSTSTVPAANAKYRAATYPTAWSGTSTDGAGGSGVANVAISFKDPSGNYWNGSAFLGAGETFSSATGTAAWTWTAPALTTNGTYTVHVVATDNVGNVESSSTSAFIYDTTAPTFGATSMTKLGNCDAFLYLTGTAVFYNPATAACANAFTMTAPLGDAGGAGASTVQFPAIASGSFSHTANTVPTPFTSSNYGWTAVGAGYAGAAQTQTLTGADGAGNTSTTTFTIKRDVAFAATAFTAPAAAAKIRNGQMISATADDGVGNAGVAQVEFRYCGGASCTYAASTALGAAIAAPGPYTTTWSGQPADGQYTILTRSTDNVGNVRDVTRTVTIDNTAPVLASSASDAVGTHVTLTFTEAGSGLDVASTTPASAFSVVRNGSGDAVTAVTVLDATHIRLTLATRVFGGDAVTVAYSSAGLTTAQQVKDVAGNPLADVAAQSVTTTATPSLATTTVTAAPGSIVANGASTSTITIRLKNDVGTNIAVSGGIVALTTNAGSLGSVTDNANGTYTATLTSSTSVATATVSATIDGSSVAATANVAFTAGAVSSTQSTVASAPPSVVADGTSSSTITVTANDAFGNPVAGQAVSLAQGAGVSAITPVSATTDGSGVATFTVSDTTAQNVTYSATIGVTAILQTAQVDFTPGPVDHFSVSAPASTTAGNALSFTVTARDATNNIVPGYAGTTAFTSSDPNATLPSSYTFVAGDNGSRTFTNAATLTTAGSKTIAVADGLMTGSASVTVDPAAADHFIVSAASPQAAGSAFDLVVTAEDAFGNVATGYLGTVHFTSTDAQATLPADYSFVAGDAGSHTFGSAAILGTVGLRTVTATDTVVGMLTGTSSAVDVGPGAAASLAVSAGGAQTAGVAFSTTVTAKDAFGNIATGYTGTVQLGSDDGQAVLPANYGFTAGDNGVHVFSTTLKTAGVKSVTATDTVIGSITGATPVTVAATAATSFTVAAASAQTAGAPFTTTVTARDAYGNAATSYAGTVQLSSDDALAVLPADYAFSAGDNGAHDFAITLKTAGTKTITAADGGLTGTSAAITVGAGAPVAARSTITASPIAIMADGTTGPATITVQARDAFDNDVTTGGATVSLATDRGSLGSVSDNGDGTYAATLTATGSSGTANVTGTLGGAAIGFPTSVGFQPPVAVVTVDAGAPAAITPATGAAVTFHANDGSATVECRLDSGPYASCTSPFTASGLVDGSHDLRLRATNGQGTGPDTLLSWTVDTTAPSVSFSTVPAAITNNPTETLTASAADSSGIAAVDFRYGADATACATGPLIFTDTTSPFTTVWTTPVDGAYVVCAIAADAVGNTAQANSAVTVDQTAPTGTFPAVGTLVGSTRYVGGNLALHATASDAPAGVKQVAFDYAGTTSGVIDTLTASPYDATWSTSLNTPDDGNYTLHAVLTDNAGNVTPLSQAVVLDNTAPSATVDDPGAFRHGTIALTVTATDLGSGVDAANTVFQAAPQGTSSWSAVGSNWTPADGTYDVRALVFDNVGNQTTTGSRTILIDNTAPTVGDDADAGWHNTAVTLTLTAADPESGVVLPDAVEYQIDGGSFTQGTSVAVPVTDGTHTITYRATNRAGVTSSDHVATVKMDTTAPNNVTLDTPSSAALLRGSSIALTETAQDATSGIASTTFRLVPGSLGAGSCMTAGAQITSPFDSTSIADGHYDMWVAALDRAGNAQCSSAPHDVVVDNTAPQSSDNAPAGAQNLDVSVNLSATDNLSGVNYTEYSLDGGANWTTGNTVTILASSGDGVTTIIYRSHDLAGNVEAPKSTQVTIDTTAPSGGANDPGSVLRGTVALTASPPDTDVVSVQFLYRPTGPGPWTSIGTDTSAPYSIPWITTGPGTPDGLYDLEEIVTDGAGNTTTVALSTKTIDNTAPGSAAVTAPAAGANIGPATISLAATAADATSGVDSVVFEVKPTGASSFTTVDADTNGAPFTGSWSPSAGIPDGPVDVRVAVTDIAGNGPTYSPVVTFTLDRTNPAVVLTAPANVVASAPLTASGSADIDHVDYEYAPQGSGSWSPIGTGTNATFSATWTTPLTDGLYDVRATAIDGGGNQGTDIKVVRVDRTAPAGTLTQPVAGATVGGNTVALAASSSDGGSGVASVTFRFRPAGGGAFSDIATDTIAPYAATWDASALASGSYDVQALITDAAGNTTTDTSLITVDSTPPSLTAFTVSSPTGGTVPLSVTTSPDTANVTYEVRASPAGAWSPIGSSSAGPSFNSSFATSALSDGTYDLRATAADQFGNVTSRTANAVAIDNTTPSLVSSSPADGSVVAGASSISAVASEPIASVDQLRLDGAPAGFAAAISGTDLDFATGALSDGLHALTGRLHDAAGQTAPFRINVTVSSGALTTMLPTGKNVSASAATVLSSAAGSATVTTPANVWQSASAMPQDFLVLRIDPAPATVAPPEAGLQFEMSPVDVRMTWNLAGTDEHAFDAPLQVDLTDATGGLGLPVTSEPGSTWSSIPELAAAGTLPPSWQDGYWRTGSVIHILTRHLSQFASVTGIGIDSSTPPRDFAAVIGFDGLTLRWAPGIPTVRQFVLYADGRQIGVFNGSEFEAKLGQIGADDTRRFTLTEFSPSGVESSPTPVLRVVPPVAGASQAVAAGALAARGFTVGKVTMVPAAGVPAGTVVGPTGVQLQAEGSAVDLQVASSATVRSAFAFSPASSPRVRSSRTTLVTRVVVTDRARIDVTLDAAPYKRLQRWHFFHVKPGSTILRLHLSRPLAPGAHCLYWKATAEGDRTVVRKTTPLRVLTAGARAHAAKPAQVLTALGKRSLQSAGATVQATTPEQAFMFATYHDVAVFVVDADVYGAAFVRSLRKVFPATAVVALSKSGTRRAELAQTGAVALPSSTTPAKLARLVARLAR